MQVRVIASSSVFTQCSPRLYMHTPQKGLDSPCLYKHTPQKSYSPCLYMHRPQKRLGSPHLYMHTVTPQKCLDSPRLYMSGPQKSLATYKICLILAFSADYEIRQCLLKEITKDESVNNCRRVHFFSGFKS